jgi:hypothetical protein
MTFAQAPDAEYPPYLLNFAGSPGERHVENLKVRQTMTFSSLSSTWLAQILREVGLSAYNKAASLMHGPDSTRLKNVEDTIQEKFVGPDCYWKNPTERSAPGYTKFFGNGWWIPFPPTLVRFPLSFVGLLLIISLELGHSLRRWTTRGHPRGF